MFYKKIALAALFSTALASGASAQTAVSVTAAETDLAKQNLELFKQLDFEGWNKRDWAVFSSLHAENVKVAGFGSKTEGLEAHLDWGKAFVGMVPDSKVMEHQIRIGAGDWTAVTGLLNDGSTMATIARWENGKIVEEYLFQLVTEQ